ncbi:hypothetical protein [Nakamurella sp.]|uniref:hypothetical protein n=1 Tax=Nakamurella sp. TaxID=1869182 RepID=UPI00378310D6
MPPTGSALRRPIPPPRAAGSGPDAARVGRTVDAALRGLPSHGWTGGWVGRRDRALLVLTQRAGLSCAAVAALTVDDITVRDGAATIRVENGEPITLRMTEDCLLCGPCALSRWLHALALAGMHSDGRVVASVIARAAPLGPHSPHVCEGATPASDGARGTLVFPVDDRWAVAPVTHSGLPVPARPVHDVRSRAAHGPHRTGPGTRSHLEVARVDGTTTPAPEDRPTALENRVRTLLNGLA